MKPLRLVALGLALSVAVVVLTCEFTPEVQAKSPVLLAVSIICLAFAEGGKR
ncbi:hypothetical protein [Solidesulfovibrio sp.]